MKVMVHLQVGVFQLSNEKKAPECLGYIGDEILPSYVGIMS